MIYTKNMNPAAEKGFTIVELVAVIIITGILSAVAMPRFFDKSLFESRFFFDDAIQGARYARQFAITKGCYTQFVLTTSGFSLMRDDDCNSSTGFSFTSAIPRPDDPSENYTSSGAPAGTIAESVVFSPQGKAGAAAGSVYTTTETLTIGSDTISIDGPTGFVR